MYLVAGELKDICEHYGAFCDEYGILKKSDASEIDGTSLASSWDW